MTLAASFSVDDYPVMVGDIMISEPARGGVAQPFRIPMHDDPNTIATQAGGMITSGLVQKVELIPIPDGQG